MCPLVSMPEKRADERTPSSSAPEISLPEKREDERTPPPPTPTVLPRTREDGRAPLPDDSPCAAIAGDHGTVGYKSLHDML